MLFLVLLTAITDLSQVHARIDADLAADKAIVAHVMVVLADNKNQGIVPVPAALGKGDDPRNNLYWGAMYGAKTHLLKRSGWQVVKKWRPETGPVLERLLLTKKITRNGKEITAHVVLDAWHGAQMKAGLETWLNYAAGTPGPSLADTEIPTGGKAHLLTFVGHNGLMEYPDLPTPKDTGAGQVRAAAVFACVSRSYFQDRLIKAGATPLLLTRQLMAPEGYVLGAALEAFFQGADANQAHKQTAAAYSKYQKCSLKAAMGVFTTGN